MAGRSERSPKSTRNTTQKAHAHGSDSREALLKAAQRVFGAKGYEGATVKDLADEAGVNISLVSYHFGGKENLYRSCMEQFGLERVEAAERVLRPATSLEDFKIRLRLFGEEIINIHTKEPNVCRMVHRAMDTPDTVTLELFKNIFNRIYVALHNFMIEAQRTGILKMNQDMEIMAGLAFGSLLHNIKADSMRALVGMRTLDEPRYRDATIDHWVALLTEGMANTHSASTPNSTPTSSSDSEERK